MFPQLLTVFLLRKYLIKFMLASIKSLTNCESPSSNPLQRARSGIPIAACDPENCSESRPGMDTGENRPVRAIESWNRNWMRHSEQFLELVSVVKESSKILCLFFF